MPFKRLARSKRCPLDNTDTIVNYKEVNLLKKFISERGKILGRARTNLCAKHQRQITLSIKQARYMALLPFVQG